MSIIKKRENDKEPAMVVWVAEAKKQFAKTKHLVVINSTEQPTCFKPDVYHAFEKYFHETELIEAMDIISEMREALELIATMNSPMGFAGCPSIAREALGRPRKGDKVREVVSIRLELKTKKQLIKNHGSIQAWVDAIILKDKIKALEGAK